MKFLKLLIGLALLPLCVAATKAVYALIRNLQVSSVGEVAPDAWWLAGGFVLWVILYFALSRPVRTYVLAHELTHAFWGLMMGAKVSKLRVSSRGGSVTLSKTNFLITLAPYFFPFYTMLTLALYAVLSYFWDLRTYEPFWLGLVGLTWAFHLTFTVTTLLEHQPDIAEHGRVFSYAIIYLFNLLGFGLWIVGVAHPTLAFFSHELLQETGLLYEGCALAGARLWATVRD